MDGKICLAGIKQKYDKILRISPAGVELKGVNNSSDIPRNGASCPLEPSVTLKEHNET